MLHKFTFDMVWNPSWVLWTLPVYANAIFDPIQHSSPVPEGKIASSLKIVLCLYDESVGGMGLWYVCRICVHIHSLSVSQSLSLHTFLPPSSLHGQAHMLLCAYGGYRTNEYQSSSFYLFVISFLSCSPLHMPMTDYLALQSFISPQKDRDCRWATEPCFIWVLEFTSDLQTLMRSAYFIHWGSSTNGIGYFLSNQSSKFTYDYRDLNWTQTITTIIIANSSIIMVPCISHISFAMIKYYKQKQLVEESIQYTDHHKRKFGQELKTGSQRRELKKPQRNADYCLVSYGLFSLFFFFFFYTTRNHLQGWHIYSG